MSKDSLQDIPVDGRGLKISIVLPYFNEELGLEMFENCKKTLIEKGVAEKNIGLTRVAGCLEIPYACLKIMDAKKYDVIIAIGIIIKGETRHFDLVAEATHNGLMQLQLQKKVPVIFGILACDNIKQAKDRVSEKGLNKGREAAIAAMIQTKIKI